MLDRFWSGPFALLSGETCRAVLQGMERRDRTPRLDRNIKPFTATIAITAAVIWWL
jgi:hypothetical protein